MVPALTSLLDRAGGRTAFFTVLYASEGAPIGFIWWALPTLLRSNGVPIEDITALTALLVLPWVLKFLWAPLIDALQTPRWGYRASIAASQTLMAVALLPLAWLDPVAHLSAWKALLLAHAIAASTQDVAIDALVINTVPVHERGRLNGAMQAGMLVGRSAFGGGALFLASQFGHVWIVLGLVGWILAALGLLLLVRVPDRVLATGSDSRSFLGALSAMFRLRSTWYGLAFALVAAAAFEAAGQLAGPFLVDRGVSSQAIGAFFGIFVVAATLVGGLLGGWLSDRWGRLRSVAIFLVGVVVSVTAVGLCDLWSQTSPSTLLVLLTMMYFFVGLFTVSSYALFMDLTHPRLGATQFSTFMAATNGCESWSAWAGGRLTAASGYPAAFLAMSLVSLLSLVLLLPLRRHASTGGR